MPMQLFYSIVLVGGNQMDKDIKGLDDLTKSTGSPGKGLM